MSGALQWQAETQSGHYCATIDLADLNAGEILVPSLVLLSSENYSFACSLTATPRNWWLAPVSSSANTPKIESGATNTGGDVQSAAKPSRPTASDADNAVTTHIDCFVAHHRVQRPRLSVHLRAKTVPNDYLLVISRRQSQSTAEPPDEPRSIHHVPCISQMVQPSRQRNRTCSPTALSMLMAYYQAPYYPAMVDACRDPQTGLYGVWPRNIVQAGRRGFTGAIELIDHWHALANYDAPFVASISFAKGQLDGAPLEQTDGHLVVVCGTTSTSVLCNDPAAKSAATVPRNYDLAQFSRAWLGSRGAAYLVQPAPNPPDLIRATRR